MCNKLCGKLLTYYIVSSKAYVWVSDIVSIDTSYIGVHIKSLY